MDLDVRLRTVALGFAGAAVVFLVLFWLVGFGEMVDVLRDARVPVLLVVFGVAVVWLTAWALSLRAVLRALGSPVGVLQTVLIFAGATFSNNVTPFGQAGGEPISALLISRATDTEYQTGLAAIASVDALHFVPSIGLGLLGLAYFAATITLGRRLVLALGVVVALAVALPVAAALAWRTRHRIERTTVRVVMPVVRRVGGALPRVTPPTEAVVEARIEGFFGAIERLTSDPRRMVMAVGFSTLGWLALATSLWLSLYALGQEVAFMAMFVAIPVGDIGEMAPLPGGLGGIEALLIGLLVSITPVPVATAGAAVLIHRVATYWLPTILGGGAAAIILSR